MFLNKKTRNRQTAGSMSNRLGGKKKTTTIYFSQLRENFPNKTQYIELVLMLQYTTPQEQWFLGSATQMLV